MPQWAKDGLYQKEEIEKEINSFLEILESKRADL